MTLKLKAVGLSVIALLALGGFAAASAHAAAGKLTNVSAGYPTIITGDQDSATTKIVLGPKTITCTTIAYESTITGPTEAVAFTPKYTSCIAEPGKLTTVIEAKACKWTATVPNVTESKLTTGVTGCAVGAPMNIKMETGGKAICEYHLGNQTGLTGSTWQNKVAEDVTFTISIQPLVEVTLGTATECGAAVGKTFSGKIEGASTVTGWEDVNGLPGPKAIGIMIG